MKDNQKLISIEFDLNTENFKNELENELNNPNITNFSIISAFITLSGAEQLIEWLKNSLSHLSSIRVLTGTYLDFTHPNALRLMLGESKINLKIIDHDKGNLHVKAYFLDKTDQKGTIFIGSSNLTASALQKNLEWNSFITSFKNPEEYRKIKSNFERLWDIAEKIDEKWITQYETRYRYFNTFYRVREEIENDKTRPSPRFAQLDALDALNRTRKLSYDKALVVLATGLGKTHLAAFDSINYKKVLYIAHVDEILEQAKNIFRQVRGFGNFGKLSDGWHEKELSDVLFVSIQKLSRTKNLSKFKPDEYEYIIIDEFHHANAQTYQTILNYFKPQFLLGLTATPFRMDRQDVSSLCDGNIPYICNMPLAIEKEWLCPFWYYGILDNTVDYSEIKWNKNSGYDETDLTQLLNNNMRANKILEEYKKYPETPTIGFCASIKHADFMTEFFNEHGIRALAVHSGQKGMDPNFAKSQIKLHQIDVIFTMNVFNEGIDLPDIRKVLLIRPTESMTIFIQQIGRGLRLAENKNHLTILDFIGNYKKSYIIPTMLLGQINPHIGKELLRSILDDQKKKIEDLDYEPKYPFPPGCKIDFELNIINDMIEKIGSIDPIRKSYVEKFQMIKKQLGRRPSLIDMIEIRENVSNYIIAFNSWWKFLQEIGELTEEEQSYSKKDRNLLKWIERIPFETLFSYEIIRFCYSSDNLKIPINEISENMHDWLENNSSLSSYVELERLKLDIPLTENLIIEIINKVISTKFRQQIESCLMVQGNYIIKDEEIQWELHSQELSERLYLRKEEFQSIRSALIVGSLYSKREIKNYYSSLGANENLSSSAYFGERSPGIVRMDSIKNMALFVTLDKSERFQDKSQDYSDKILSLNEMIWETQNQTTLTSPNGLVITEQTSGFTKQMFVRLQEDDPHYGNCFFYLGIVKLIKYEEKKGPKLPFKVYWKLKEMIPTPIFEYFTKSEFRKYEMKEDIFIEEKI